MSARSSSRRSHRRSHRRPATVAPRGGPARIESVERRTLMSSGVLDPSWNRYGTLSIAPPANAVARTTISAVQPDERVVVGGTYTVGSTGSTQLQRLTPQGQPDSTFNPQTVNFAATNVTVENSGSILVGGPSLERLNQDGSVDTTFGSGTGTISLPFTASGVVVQGDDKIVVAGNTPAGVPLVARYNADGSVDTSFGSNGRVTIAIAGVPGSFYKLGSLSLTSSGQTLVGFAVNGDTTYATFGVVRLTTAGAFDGSFGVGGVSEVKGYPLTSASGTMVVAPTGVIYQVGTYNYGQETGVGYLMVYAADGRKAYQSPAGGLDIFASDVTIAADNKPVIVGTGLRGSGSTKQTYIAVNRFLPVDPNAPVFTPDTTWGGTGLVAVAYNGPSAQDNASVGDLGFAAHEQPNGNVVVGGTSVNPGTNLVSTFNVTRLAGDGSLAASVATVTGTTYFDQNFDGTRAANDQGLPGFGAFLDANNNGTFDAGEVRVFSDASGRYTFNGLTPATYHVGQILPAGYTHTTPGSAVTASRTATVVANQTLINQDFGVTGTNSITGTFFTDANGNGTKDSGEAGISGGIVFLDLNGDQQLTSVDTSVVTDANGTFTFTHLTPNTFRVRAVIASGHNLTTPATFPLMVTLTGVQQASGFFIGQI